jgi:hypothetical protein
VAVTQVTAIAFCVAFYTSPLTAPYELYIIYSITDLPHFNGNSVA